MSQLLAELEQLIGKVLLLQKAVVWIEVLDGAGGTFYVHIFTRKSTRDRPAALDTLLALDGEAVPGG